MQIEFKGIIKNVGTVKDFTSFKVIQFNVIKPGWTDEFGDKKGKDEVYPIQAFKEKIDQVTPLKTGDKVHVKAYLNSRETVTDNDVNYFLQMNLADIKKL